MKKIKIEKSLVPITLILTLNFISEIIHGILYHRFGSADYFPITVGEMIRGPLLLFMIGYAVLYASRIASRAVLCALAGIVLLVLVQGLFFGFSLGVVINTLLRDVRWLYLFFVLNFVSREVSRRHIAPDKIIGLLKWLIVIFYSVPIFLTALGIAGYTVYADTGRLGFGGFVMNSNVVASVFVLMLPFYVTPRRLVDYILLGVYLGAGILLGSKLVYIGFALVLGPLLLWSSLNFIAQHKLRMKKVTIIAWVLFAASVVGVSFTSLVGKVIGIFQGLQNLFDWYLSGKTGYTSTFVDVLTSQRTWRLYQFLDWAKEAKNLLPLLIGGGLPNYTRLYAEVDWIDLISLSGLLGLIIFYGTLGFLLWRVFKSKRRPYHYETFFMLSLAIGASLTSGHTFDGPVIGIVIGCVLGTFFVTRLKLGSPHLPAIQTESTNAGEGSLG